MWMKNGRPCSPVVYKRRQGGLSSLAARSPRFSRLPFDALKALEPLVPGPFSRKESPAPPFAAAKAQVCGDILQRNKGRVLQEVPGPALYCLPLDPAGAVAAGELFHLSQRDPIEVPLDLSLIHI